MPDEHPHEVLEGTALDLPHLGMAQTDAEWRLNPGNLSRDTDGPVFPIGTRACSGLEPRHTDGTLDEPLDVQDPGRSLAREHADPASPHAGSGGRRAAVPGRTEHGTQMGT